MGVTKLFILHHTHQHWGVVFRARKAGGLELEVQHLASLPGAEGLSPISSGDLNSSSASPLISGVLKEQL